MILLSLTVATLIAKGGPSWPVPPPDPVTVTVYDDDPALGAMRCRGELRQWAPGSTCHVEPELHAPNPLAWAWAWWPW